MSQTSFEFADRAHHAYSATLASQFNRSRKIMLTMPPWRWATRSRSPSTHVQNNTGKIDNGTINRRTVLHYVPGKSIDAVTSATEPISPNGAALSVDGKRYNTTYLHLREWLECIRSGKQPSRNIGLGFEEAITAHMGTRLSGGRTIYWDAKKRRHLRVVNLWIRDGDLLVVSLSFPVVPVAARRSAAFQYPVWVIQMRILSRALRDPRHGRGWHCRAPDRQYAG